MLKQLGASRLFGEHPVVQFKDTILRSEIFLEVIFPTTVIKHLFWLKIANQLLHIVVCAFASEEFTRRNVEECHATSRLPEMHGGEEVVFLVVEHIVAHCHTRCHQFGDAPFHQCLCQLGIFQLVAYCHSPSSPYQFWQVSVEGMVREPCHLCGCGLSAIVSLCQCDAENLRCCYGILAICLIEIATPEQHQRIGMLCLQREKLLHHWCQAFFFLCHVLGCFL